MTKFYCKWCGDSFDTIEELENSHCLKNPEGKHEIYNGYDGGVGQWTCEFCKSTSREITLAMFTDRKCLEGGEQSPSNYHIPM